MGNSDFYGGYYILNGDIISENESQVLYSGLEIYEVIRAINGVPLFIEEHFERLKHSLLSTGNSLQIDLDEFKKMIMLILQINSKQNINVKVIVFIENGDLNCLTYLLNSFYPEKGVYESGVETATFKWERDEPNVKLANALYKQKVNSEIKKKQVFELLLVNQMNFITEGSRSNVFFVLDDILVTAPDNSVLLGISRQYAIKASSSAGIKIEYRMLSIKEICDIKACFLTGTSIKVLPISSVDNYSFHSAENRIVKTIKERFDQIVSEYINCYE